MKEKKRREECGEERQSRTIREKSKEDGTQS